MSFKKEKYQNILDTINNYVKRKGYILGKNKDEEYIYSIYDRDREKDIVSNIMDIFVGSSFFLERIRLKINITIKNDSIDIIINGDVMMRNWDIINDRPHKRDIVRCKNQLNEFIEELEKIYIST